ncbi:MAG TPA: 50S ribosomal protein L24 [Bryobacteraceae bacterium]|jgi:large subunit ribosomal protein L24|nr:50S ribosomal protein L24 [Bryobacteraceae bacterium]
MSQPLKKDKREPVRIQLRKNDQVKVIAGRDKGKTGRVLDVNPADGRILVEHVNMIKRHTRKNPAKQIAGGIAEREASIAVSNVMILCGKCGAVRIKHHLTPVAGGKTKRQRVCHKCGQTLDKK